MSSPPPSPAAQAETLLHLWEQHAGPPATVAYTDTRPALLAQLTALCAALRPEDEVNIDHEDIRTVLRSAAQFRIGTAANAGPDRATHVARAALAALQLPQLNGPLAAPARSVLLGIISPVAEPLEMDELTTILETVQCHFGPELEMIFGHGDTEDPAETALRAWLLVGYG